MSFLESNSPNPHPLFERIGRCGAARYAVAGAYLTASSAQNKLKRRGGNVTADLWLAYGQLGDGCGPHFWRFRRRPHRWAAKLHLPGRRFLPSIMYS
jgi:hypothetical protein